MSEEDDRSQEVLLKAAALLEEGKAVTDANKFAEAINILSKALLPSKNSSEQKAAVLLERSKAYIGIPARDSERSAIMAMDPVSLAELGLNDACKAVSLHPANALGYHQQAMCYILLEDYTNAKKAIMEGLGVSPFEESLQKALQDVRQHLIGSRSASPAPSQSQPSNTSTKRKARTVEDAECSLCMKLFFEPVTIPCGHTFCRQCFLRARDHHNKCPMCRTLLPVTREVPVTSALSQLIQSSFPEEYEARRAESQQVADVEDGKEAPLSVFVMSNIFPGEEMSLNIFEPRYRLLIRRCLEGTRRFGLATVDRNHELQKVACEVEIMDCQATPDGRFLIDIIGTRRFRVLNAWEQDGYRVVEPEFFRDDPPDGDSPATEQLKSATETAVDSVRNIWERVATCRVGRLPELPPFVNRLPESPTPEAAEKLSFWIAGLMPAVIHRFDRLALLEMTSTTARLQLLTARLDALALGLSEGSGRGCRIM